MALNRDDIKRDYGLFIKKIARKKSKNGYDPNDRSYDRRIEERLKRMKPEDINALINDDEDCTNK